MGVQHRIHYRLVAQSHVHERKEWKSVEDLDVVFVMTSRVRRLHPIECAFPAGAAAKQSDRAGLLAPAELE